MSITTKPRFLYSSIQSQPGYQVRREDLRAFLSPCPACGRPTHRLHPELAPDQVGSGDRPGPDLSLLGGLLKHFANVPCPSCELRLTVHSLFPPIGQPSVVDPAEGELGRLREALAQATRSLKPAPVVYEGATFDPGTVFLTREAARALGRCCSGSGPSSPAADEVRGHAHVHDLVARHVRGDGGILRSITEGNAARGAEQGPLSSLADRSAAAVAGGHGVVRSVYPLSRTELDRFQMPREVSIGDLHVRSVVEEPPATLVCMATEVDSD